MRRSNDAKNSNAKKRYLQKASVCPKIHHMTKKANELIFVKFWNDYSVLNLGEVTLFWPSETFPAECLIGKMTHFWWLKRRGSGGEVTQR